MQCEWLLITQVKMSDACYMFARLGYSQKGWTDNTIGIEYIKAFNKQTRTLAKGRYCVLYVDGHKSHITHGFLLYCWENKIHVPCYAAYGTHVYQGLDVVVFRLLKTEFGKRRDHLLRETGKAVSKENFLQVYREAHLKVLTPELIRTAFRKTGIVPFDRNVIMPDMMAPSRDSSYKIFTPIVPPTPVWIVTDLLVDAVQAPISRSNKNSPQGQEAALTLPVHIAIPQLASSDAQFLISQSPIKSSSILPEMTAVEISPVKQCTQPRKKDLLTSEVKTQLEKHLQEELVVEDAKITYLKGYILQLQSQMVLQCVMILLSYNHCYDLVILSSYGLLFLFNTAFT